MAVTRTEECVYLETAQSLPVGQSTIIGKLLGKLRFREPSLDEIPALCKGSLCTCSCYFLSLHHTFNHCILASTSFRSPKTAFTEITKQSLTETAEEAFWT